MSQGGSFRLTCNPIESSLRSCIETLQPRNRFKEFGRAFRSEHLDQVKAEIERGGPQVALDLKEVVDLVDVEGIRFLNACKAEGIQMLHCSPYYTGVDAPESAKSTAPINVKKGQAPQPLALLTHARDSSKIL